MNKKTVTMWYKWLLFMLGMLIGNIYRLLPIVALYVITAEISLIVWNRFVVRAWSMPRATLLEGIAFVAAVRLLGMVWRGEKNPLIRKMHVQNFYE